MLRKVRNQENVIMVFFVVTLLGVGMYAFFGKMMVDLLYFLVMLFYFCRFLRIKKSGK